MIRRLIILLLIVGCVFAQNLPPQSDLKSMTAAEKMILFELNEKSPTRSFIYSLLLLSSGHAYAGNWRKGLLFLSAEIGTMYSGFQFNELADDKKIVKFG